MLPQEILVRLVAQHPYHTGDPTHLSFPAQATITAQPGQDGNTLWYGNYGNQSGWFYPSYCRLQPTLRRRRIVQPHASFNGFPTPKESSLPSRTQSWNATCSLRESYSKASKGERDTLTTAESRSLSPQPESREDEDQQNHDSKDHTVTLDPPSQHVDSRSHANDRENTRICAETTPKRRLKPLRLLRFNSDSTRSRDEPTSPTVPRPALFSRANRLRSFFRDRSEQQAADRINTLSPPSCIYVECSTSTPPPTHQEQKQVRQPHPSLQEVNYYERYPTKKHSITTGPVDPIEVWAAEFRQRQQQKVA